MDLFHRPSTRAVALVLALMLMFSVGAWAQAGTGEITGVVSDPTGAVVPKVQVKLINPATGVERTTETSAAGIYRFAALPVVGTYTIQIDHAGFKSVTVKEIAISVGSTFNQDVKLQLGTSSEVVDVVSGAQLVQTAESQVSSLVDQRVWQSMPLEVRNQNEFINLVAGAAPSGMVGNGDRGAAVNGARTGSGNYLVEGVDNNDQGQGGRSQLSDAGGGAATGISPEAIQEYRVITNSFAAEYGKAGGFVTDTVLKSGTNQFHGSLFEYNRVQALAAQHYENGRNTDPVTGKNLKDSLVRNQFGGSFGGRIIPDRTFFYTAVEVHRMRQGAPVSGTSVTKEFLDFVDSGRFRTWAESDPNGVCMVNAGQACPGAFARAATLGPIFKRLMTKGPFPLAQATTNESHDGQGLWTYGLRYPVPVYGLVSVIDPYFLNENRWSLKVDHRISDKDSITGTYLLQSSMQGSAYGGGDEDIGAPWDSPGRGQNLAISWNHMFTPTILNVFKASYLRHRADYPNPNGYETMPSIYSDGLDVGFGSSSNSPQFFTDNQFQFQNHLSFVKGKHQFKAGGEYRRIRNGSSFEGSKNGEFAAWGVEDLVTDFTFGDEMDAFMAGLDSEYEPSGSWWVAEASVDPTTGRRPVYYRGYRSNEIAMYFQDDWRVTNRLTVNLGLRYEYFGPPHNYKKGLDSNFYFGVPTTPVPTISTNPYFPRTNPFYARVATGSFQQRDNEIWNKDTNNFSPRFGFAYDVFGNQKFVLRGGAGIMYDRIYNNLFENIRFNSPFFAFNGLGIYGNGVAGGALHIPGAYTDNFSEANTARFADPSNVPLPSPRHMDQNLVIPYYEQFHLGMQYEVVKGYVIESEYVSTLGRKLTGIVDINTFNGRTVPGLGGRRVNTSLGRDNYRSNGFASNYHGWQTTFRKSYSSGLQFQANYTWSKALDYISDAMFARTGARPTNNMNPSEDYGPADFDIRHRFVGTISYELPFLRKNPVLGGWTVNSIVRLQSGTPFSPINSSSSYDINRDGERTDRIPYIGSGNPNDSVLDGSPYDGYFDKEMWNAGYKCPTSVNSGHWCNQPWGRNSIVGPGFAQVDLGISKKFKINERTSVSVMGNFFNLFNRANFTRPDNDAAYSSTFGKSLGTYDPRLTQLALRIDF